MKKIFEEMAVTVMISVPDPFNGYHEMKHNSAVTCQNQLEFLNQKVKHDFLYRILKLLSLS